MPRWWRPPPGSVGYGEGLPARGERVFRPVGSDERAGEAGGQGDGRLELIAHPPDLGLNVPARRVHERAGGFAQ